MIGLYNQARDVGQRLSTPGLILFSMVTDHSSVSSPAIPFKVQEGVCDYGSISGAKK
jgi:hypothetical protein